METGQKLQSIFGLPMARPSKKTLGPIFVHRNRTMYKVYNLLAYKLTVTTSQYVRKDRILV